MCLVQRSELKYGIELTEKGEPSSASYPPLPLCRLLWYLIRFYVPPPLSFSPGFPSPLTRGGGQRVSFLSVWTEQPQVGIGSPCTPGKAYFCGLARSPATKTGTAERGGCMGCQGAKLSRLEGRQTDLDIAQTSRHHSGRPTQHPNQHFLWCKKVALVTFRPATATGFLASVKARVEEGQQAGPGMLRAA